MAAKNTALVERQMEFMPCTLGPSDSLALARALFDEQQLDQLPVVSHDRLVGIVSTQNLRSVSSKGASLRKALACIPIK